MALEGRRRESFDEFERMQAVVLQIEAGTNPVQTHRRRWDLFFLYSRLEGFLFKEALKCLTKRSKLALYHMVNPHRISSVIIIMID